MLDRRSEIVLARVMLARVAQATGADAELARERTALRPELLRGASAEARRAAELLMESHQSSAAEA